MNRLIALFGLAATLSWITGCGSGQSNNSGHEYQEPVILSQPANDSVPLGLSASFAVGVTGYPLQYQWLKDGNPISDAQADTYTIPATEISDNGSVFTVTITNDLGSVTSDPATLTVTARAPAPGDLRFQQVDSPSTVNGYNSEESTNLSGNGNFGFSPGIGTPLSIGPGCPSDGTGDPLGCQWLLTAFDQTPNSVQGTLSVNYQAFPFSSLDSELMSLDNGDTVVTGLDLEPNSLLFATSWTSSSTVNGFDMAERTVAPADFQTYASQDGEKSRVITAVSWDNGQIVYLSYGWKADSTLYDVQVSNTTFDNVTNAVQQLASAGFIITATGGTSADGILLVGTRVHGDTIARPLIVVEPPQESPTLLNSQGYAVVGLLYNFAANGNLLSNYWIGER